jgi:pimeloyl-ACP methyl ester carboxylesterase
VNDRFCSNNAAVQNCTSSPVFLYIGDEGPESGKHVSEGMYIHDLAKQHNALLVALEHRYYGQSYPTPTMTTAELSYLSSAQALADIARFIPALRREYSISDDAKVISFGGSYPGSLSAWVRLKYPHLVSGAIASSAPLVAALEFPEYMDVCAKALQRFGGDTCLGKHTFKHIAAYSAVSTMCSAFSLLL